MPRGDGGGRPPALRSPKTRRTVIETALDEGSLRAAAQAAGIHERSITRYAKANPWFDTILSAALARHDRMEVLASLEQWADAGMLQDVPTSEAAQQLAELVEPQQAEQPPLRPREQRREPEPPAPVPEVPGALPPARDVLVEPVVSTPAPPEPALAEPVEVPERVVVTRPVEPVQMAKPSPAPAGVPAMASIEPVAVEPMLVMGVELVGSTVEEFLGVDHDLVADANDDLVQVGLPRLEDICAMVVKVANNPAHPACVAMMRELVRIGVTPLQKAQARRLVSEIRREQSRPAIDAEASEVSAPRPASGARPRRGTGMVVLEVPANKARPHLARDTEEPDPDETGIAVLRRG